VVSNTFEMGEWEPEKRATVGDDNEDSYLSKRLFLWKIPEKGAK
jgi:hypothetical protein